LREDIRKQRISATLFASAVPFIAGLPYPDLRWIKKLLLEYAFGCTAEEDIFNATMQSAAQLAKILSTPR
jgi:hypothetical protein